MIPVKLASQTRRPTRRARNHTPLAHSPPISPKPTMTPALLTRPNGTALVVAVSDRMLSSEPLSPVKIHGRKPMPHQMIPAANAMMIGGTSRVRDGADDATMSTPPVTCCTQQGWGDGLPIHCQFTVIAHNQLGTPEALHT